MIHRIDVVTTRASRGGASGIDPLGEAIRHQIIEYGVDVGPVETRRVFLLDSASPAEQTRELARRLLADPIVESAEVVEPGFKDAPGLSRIEVHLKPGVMDPVAASTEAAAREMGLAVNEVRTGRAYLIARAVDPQSLRAIAGRVLGNPVIESIHLEPFVPQAFAHLPEPRFELRRVAVRELSDDQLTRLSRDGHLFLNLAEMRAIQDHYRALGREPTDIELETLAQTWSEHCVHKTLKSAVEVEEHDAAGNVVATRRYDNLIKDTIFASTQTLMREGKGDFCLSVFKDNAGVIAFDDTDAVCMKVETHNRPSAIDPYGGSATGAGGCIRDILGTGLAARPVANTDVFCVAHPTHWRQGDSAHAARHDAAQGDAASATQARPSGDVTSGDMPSGALPSEALPPGVIHPKRILQQVVAGVRDYGNRMGIPTVNGAVFFDDRYVGNPLVFCGCVGVIPRDKITKAARAGDAIVVMGGRTGRDGIHGATFSSAELTSKHADEFSHAVQIGNAITQKKMADVILAARDRGLFTAITDCGAGGLSSAVGEMGEKLGARVELDRVPLKYAGLRYDEIWISEAQERMVLSVPQENVAALLALASAEDVEATVIGHFGTHNHELLLHFRGHEVGRMSMAFVHGGLPMPTRKAVVRASAAMAGGEAGASASSSPAAPSHAQPPADHEQPASVEGPQAAGRSIQSRLLALLSHPNIASKHWIIRQYDHEVQGGSVIKPLVGPHQQGPSDAAVLRPKLGSRKGVVIANGLTPHIADPYAMALASIDEAIRNAVCVGADPARLAILDNFCWPGTDDPQTMGTLVRAAEACRDAALTYRIPFISGKDSLHNQFKNSQTGQVIRIPPTLLISSIGVIDDIARCVTMDFKKPGSLVVLVTPGPGRTALSDLAQLHHTMHAALSRGLVAAAHDVSDGGLLVAAAEMAIASGLGLNFMITSADTLFAERSGAYVIEVRPEHSRELFALISDTGAMPAVVADTTADGRIVVPATDPFADPACDVTVDACRAAWLSPLDW